MRSAALIPLCALLLSAAACSEKERATPSAEDTPSRAAEVAAAPAEPAAAGIEPMGEAVPADEFIGFIERLEQMKSVERQTGETLLRANTLIFDYEQRLVQMEDRVRVEDDHGNMETERLTGRFTVSNRVESIEAGGGVYITSNGREAVADTAVYDYPGGTVELMGRAAVSEGGNRLSGESIRFWIRDERKMICEPNALLEISGMPGDDLQGLSGREMDTEIRANSVIYDETARRATLQGNVRLRDPRMAMNCGEARIFLKDDNKIDWIETVSEVIIQSEDRKALAERATYHADEGKVMLEGKPMVKQGPNVITGDRITFWHETRRMVCEPNARALLYLDEETRAKFLKDLND